MIEKVRGLSLRMQSEPVFECRRVPQSRDLGFWVFSGTILGQKRKLKRKLGPFEFTFLSPRFCISVSAGQNRVRFWSLTELIGHLGFYISI